MDDIPNMYDNDTFLCATAWKGWGADLLTQMSTPAMGNSIYTTTMTNPESRK